MGVLWRGTVIKTKKANAQTKSMLTRWYFDFSAYGHNSKDPDQNPDLFGSVKLLSKIPPRKVPPLLGGYQRWYKVALE